MSMCDCDERQKSTCSRLKVGDSVHVLADATPDQKSSHGITYDHDTLASIGMATVDSKLQSVSCAEFTDLSTLHGIQQMFFSVAADIACGLLMTDFVAHSPLFMARGREKVMYLLVWGGCS